MTEAESITEPEGSCHQEYSVPYHEVEVHPNRPETASNVPHFHIGKTGHIPIIGDIPTWLEEVIYDN